MFSFNPLTFFFFLNSWLIPNFFILVNWHFWFFPSFNQSLAKVLFIIFSRIFRVFFLRLLLSSLVNFFIIVWKIVNIIPILSICFLFFRNIIFEYFTFVSYRLFLWCCLRSFWLSFLILLSWLLLIIVCSFKSFKF